MAGITGQCATVPVRRCLCRDTPCRDRRSIAVTIGVGAVRETVSWSGRTSIARRRTDHGWLKVDIDGAVRMRNKATNEIRIAAMTSCTVWCIRVRYRLGTRHVTQGTAVKPVCVTQTEAVLIVNVVTTAIYPRICRGLAVAKRASGMATAAADETTPPGGSRDVMGCIARS